MLCSLVLKVVFVYVGCRKMLTGSGAVANPNLVVLGCDHRCRLEVVGSFLHALSTQLEEDAEKGLIEGPVNI